MKKHHWIAAGALAFGTAGIAMAADIGNLSGQSCGDSTGTWHFVNNQTGGVQTPGTLYATWSSGNSCLVSAYSVLKNTQHFECVASGTLLSASTNLPGRLVLSHFTCGSPPPPPPPECDPKKEICK